jgi:DNA polymerase-1|tara:strand:- start:348 stop:1067 length:720 start_codon:yes stop_codon:yes gene_type:complete
MLLIDSDFLAYKAAQACEIGIDFGEDVIIAQSQFSEVLRVFHNELNKVTKAMMEDDFILYFSSTENFRKKIYPDYKGHRMKRKPLGYKRLVNYCRENHNFKLIEGLEADDTIGIEATRFADPNNIIVSPDKDMRQIPSALWNLTDDVVEITKDDGDRWHLIQSLSGDPTDGYSGCPGIGVKRATELLDKNENKWEAVCKAYRDRGLSDDDALLNARLAKILQKEDFDHDRNQPILWTPN